MEKSTENAGYFIKIDEQGAEMVRLINQAQMLTQHLGGLFPKGFDTSSAQTILDVACGPGSWALDVAWRYPDKHVIGADISPLVIQYAAAMARAQKRPNAEFIVMDALKPWPWSDTSIDIVNARLTQGFMPMQSWLPVLQEAWRVTTPGGWIILTESENMLSSSRALIKIREAVENGLRKLGQKTTQSGLAQGFPALWQNVLPEAGYSTPTLKETQIDFSANAPAHDMICRDLDMIFLLLKPFILKLKEMEEEEVDQLIREWNADKYKPDFTGRWDYITAWARKSE